MFNRVELKERAKRAMAPAYWMLFAACAIVSVITGMTGMISGGMNIYMSLIGGGTAYVSPAAGVMIGLIGILLGLMSIAVSIFLLQPLMVGLRRFFVRNAQTGEANLQELFFAFKNNYINVVKVTFMKTLFLFLWGLIAVGAFLVVAILGGVLFAATGTVRHVGYYASYDVMQSLMMVAFVLFALIVYAAAFIPMIIKSYEYYMVEYLLCENPDIDWRDALAESKAMMQGNKWATFVLELSFLGWFLLGFLVCCIGTLFIQPYYQATLAQLYLQLRNKPKTTEPIILDSGDTQ